MKTNTLATKADREEIETLKSKVQDNIERNIRLADDLALLKAELEMKEKIKSHDDGLATEGSEFLLAPGEMPFPDVPVTDSEAQLATIDEARHHEMILDAVQRGLGSKTALMKETGLEETVIIQTLANLVEQRKIIETKVGKRLKYTTLEQELQAKLKIDLDNQIKETPPKKGKKSAKKSFDKKSEEPAPAEPPKEEPTLSAKESESTKNEFESSPIKSEPREKLPPSPYDFERQKPLKSKKKSKKVQEPIESKEPVESPEHPIEDKPIVTDNQRKKGKSSPPKEKKRKDVAQSKKEMPEKDEPVAESTVDVKPVKAKEELPAESKSDRELPIEKVIEAMPEELVRIDDLPVIKKTLAELSDDEIHVLNAISEEGMTVSGIQSKVGKHLKRFALLRALRVLIDSGHVGILTKGRLELYQKINVQKMDKMKQENKQKEVK
jgi:hypothetical protein